MGTHALLAGGGGYGWSDVLVGSKIYYLDATISEGVCAHTHFETEYGLKSRREMRRYVAWYIRELKRVIRDGNLSDLLSDEIGEDEFILFFRTEGVEICLSQVSSA